MPPKDQDSKTPAPPLVAVNSLAQIRDFRFLILARCALAFAMQAQAVIVGWQVYQIRSSTLLLGLLGLTEAIPAITSSLFSGHFVDSHRPAAVYRSCLLVLTINAAIQLLVSFPQFPLSADFRLVTLFTAVFVTGLVRSFAGPSYFSLVGMTVPRHLYSAASAWSVSAFQAAAILGPATGGLIFGLVGGSAAFAILPLFCFVAWLSISSLSPAAAEHRNRSVREPALQSIRSGLRFVFDQKVMISAMALDMFSVLFGGAVAMLPAFSAQVLHAGPSALGLLRAATSVGSLMTVFTLALRPLKVIDGRALLLAAAGFGLSIVGFGISTHLIPAIICLALSGAFDGVSVTIRQTILQILTPENMRGRVSAVSTIFISSSNEIGGFESGMAATLMGLVPSIVFGGLMTLGIVAITAWVSPQLRRARITH